MGHYIPVQRCVPNLTGFVSQGRPGRLIPVAITYLRYLMMGSLKYEISQHCKELQANKPVGGKHTSDKSWKSYMDASIKFGEWCKRRYRCRHFTDCRPYIQDYADWLVQQGKSASTIHTYLAGVCRIFEVSLTDVRKPKRVTSQNTRSRGLKGVDNRNDAAREASPRLHDLQLRSASVVLSMFGLEATTLCTMSLGIYASE